MTQYRDRDNDVWAEGADGVFRIVEPSDSIAIGSRMSSLADVRAEYGPLTEITSPDLDPGRLEKTLRAYVTRAELADAFTSLAISVRYAEDFEAGVTSALDELAYAFRETS